jgi:hypothetical protein
MVFGERGKRAPAPVEQQRYPVKQDGDNGDQHQHVEGSGYAGVQQVKQADGLPPEYRRMDELYPEQPVRHLGKYNRPDKQKELEYNERELLPMMDSNHNQIFAQKELMSYHRIFH